jgi:hypothetical protein
MVEYTIMCAWGRPTEAQGGLQPGRLCAGWVTAGLYVFGLVCRLGVSALEAWTLALGVGPAVSMS